MSVNIGTLETLKKMHHGDTEVYVVGGFVRDKFLGINNPDLDIVIRGMSEKDIIKFLKKYGKVRRITLAKTNNKFSITTLLFKTFDGKREAQITLPRKGKKQIPKSYHTLKDDVKHRDFKINCLYLPVTSKNIYLPIVSKNVIDITGGIKDLQRKIITANGNPYERIKESPIRMLRAISLAARLNFSIDVDLLNAISDCSKMLNHTPLDAIRTEFNKIIMSDKPSRYLKLLQRLGLLKIINYELNECVGVSQNKKYHKHDVFEHLIYTCDNAPKDLVLRLAGLFHDIGKPRTRYQAGWHGKITFHKHEVESVKITRVFMEKLNYDYTTKKKVLNLIEMHMYYYTDEWNDATLRRFIKKSGLNHTYIGRMGELPLFVLRGSERLGNGLKKVAVTKHQLNFEKRLEEILIKTAITDVKDLCLNGNDIKKAFDIKQGKKIGELLKYLLDKVLKDQSLNTKQKLLELVGKKLSCKKAKTK